MDILVKVEIKEDRWSGQEIAKLLYLINQLDLKVYFNIHSIYTYNSKSNVRILPR